MNHKMLKMTKYQKYTGEYSIYFRPFLDSKYSKQSNSNRDQRTLDFESVRFRGMAPIQVRTDQSRSKIEFDLSEVFMDPTVGFQQLDSSLFIGSKFD